jgi:hypothetical protein
MKIHMCRAHACMHPSRHMHFSYQETIHCRRKRHTFYVQNTTALSHKTAQSHLCSLHHSAAGPKDTFPCLKLYITIVSNRSLLSLKLDQRVRAGRTSVIKVGKTRTLKTYQNSATKTCRHQRKKSAKKRTQRPLPLCVPCLCPLRNSQALLRNRQSRM